MSPARTAAPTEEGTVRRGRERREGQSG